MTQTTNLDPTVQRQQIFDAITNLCVVQGMTDVFISPGSRSAPLTLAFARNQAICCRVVYDERSAAYMAMGLAQQLRRPVGLVCTSGTAALNYAPAVTEAFYQQIPLVVITADRPPEWIDQQDNQSIHQSALYAPHCRGSFDLPTDLTHLDARHFAQRIINEAFQLATGLQPGPVQINVPLREPLYTPASEPFIVDELAKRELTKAALIRRLEAAPQLSESAWGQLIDSWQQAKRILIVAGSHPPDADLIQALNALAEGNPAVVLIADVTANLLPHGSAFPHADMILGTQAPAARQAMQPELLITFGGPLVSKYLKLFLRQYPPAAQWHLQPEGVAPDTYQTLTHLLPMQPTDFFQGLRLRLQATTNGALSEDQAYSRIWHELEAEASRKLDQFLTSSPFGEFVAIREVLGELPPGSHLQVGNSMTIRYVNFIAALGRGLERAIDPVAAGEAMPIAVHSNRGTSGIDGTVSTAVGAALAHEAITTLMVGDLAFFYDRNGLWHQNLPANLRIVLLNNHGGGIFDMIEGPNRLEKAERQHYFLTPQPLTAERTAADHGCEYLHAADFPSLKVAISRFFAPNPRPMILEITTDMESNTQIFQAFKKMVQSLGDESQPSEIQPSVASAPSLALGGQSYPLADLKAGVRDDLRQALSENARHVLEFSQQWLNQQATFIIHTSGSTGAPKPIEITRSQMAQSAQATGQAVGLRPGDQTLICLPTRYIAGRMMLVRGFELGLRMWVVEPASDPFAELMAAAGDTFLIDFMAVVPLQMQTLLSGPAPYRTRLNGMKAILVGGGPISPALQAQIQTLSAPVYQTFGMTETVTHFALRRLTGPNASEAYVPLPGVRIGIDERGCLNVRSPVTRGETLQTNDQVRLDDDGSFVWLGRYDNVINSGGVKVHPEVVERALEVIMLELGYPETRFFVAGLPDARLGDQVTAIFEGNLITEALEGKIREAVAGRLSAYEAPRAYLSVPRFSETPTSKIDRAASLALL